MSGHKFRVGALLRRTAAKLPYDVIEVESFLVIECWCEAYRILEGDEVFTWAAATAEEKFEESNV